MVTRPLAGSYQASSPAARQFEMAAWAVYTPTWTNSSVNPTLGDGVVAGRYRRHGTLLALQATITVGSTTTPGSGTIRISLPSGMAGGPAQYIGSGYWFDSNTGIFTPAVSILDPAATFVYPWIGTGTSPGNANGLASGDVISVGGVFEIDAA